MKDPRIDDYLEHLGKELSGTISIERVEEHLLEAEGHLEEAIEEFRALGHADPVGAALGTFGSVADYGKAVGTAGGGILLKDGQQKAMKWLALALLVPMCADVAMDLSSWLTGSDSGLYAVSIPVVVYFAIRFCWASRSVRRPMLLPITVVVLGSFVLYAAVGGVTRASGRCRGTAYRRRLGLIHDALPEKQKTLALVESAYQAFTPEKPTPGIGYYRLVAGYLTPTIPDQWRKAWKDDPRARRWLIDGLRLEPVEDYSAARQVWQSQGPQILSLAKSGVAGEEAEIRELDEVVHTPWLESVASDSPQKFAMFVFAYGNLLALHLVGMAIGAVGRMRNRNTTIGV